MIRKNVHQQHFEDLVLYGKDGLDELNDKIDKFIRSFTSDKKELNTTVKIDGAPSVFMWNHLDGYPDNSIALKGFVNGPQSSLTSYEDIENKYGDRPGMVQKLSYCLDLAKYIPSGEAWQGDCLFTHNDLVEVEINGKNYLTFRPNKIVYAFSEDNSSYDEVKNANFGIAFHTRYKGSADGLSQDFNVDPTVLNVPDTFYIMSPSLNASRSGNDYNLDEILKLYENFKLLENKLINDPAYEELINNRLFITYWNTFENKNISDKRVVHINRETFLDDLKLYIKDRQKSEYEKKLSTLKTDKGKENAEIKYNESVAELQNLIESNKDTLRTIVDTLNAVVDIKMLLWEGFKKTQLGYTTFYQSKSKGYLPADMEGIAMSDMDGNIVKIVDRSVFSANNRDDDIISGFNHSKNEEFNIFSEDVITISEARYRNKFENLLENKGKVAAVAFGRLNPPTIGHLKLVNKLKEVADINSAEPLLYLSHKNNHKDDPLEYEEKYKWVNKAFGHKVNVVHSNLRTIIDVLKDLYNKGYRRIIYVGSNARVGGDEDMSKLILKYNGQPTKAGKIEYDFDSIDFVGAGERSATSGDISERASGRLVRKLVREDNFNEFKEYVPFPEDEALELFNILKNRLK